MNGWSGGTSREAISNLKLAGCTVSNEAKSKGKGVLGRRHMALGKKRAWLFSDHPLISK